MKRPTHTSSHAEHVPARSRSQEANHLSIADLDLDHFDIEEEFYKYFDWDRLCQDSGLAHQSHQAGPNHITEVVASIPNLLDSYLVHNLEENFSQMNASFHNDHDAESSSDYTNTNGASPPGLDPTRSTSPSDHSDGLLPELLDNQAFDPTALKKVQAQDDKWTYPLKDAPKTAANTKYQSPLLDPSSKTASSPALKRRHEGDDSGKRQRQLLDPGQTADVRKTGACIPCRVAKIRCRDDGVCPRCHKVFPDHSGLTCIRLTPYMTWPNFGKTPDVWSPNAAEEEALYSAPHFYVFAPRDISVFFDRDMKSTPLRVTVQEYRQDKTSSPSSSSTRYAGFPQGHVPSHDVLKGWVESQIRRHHKPVFEHAVQSFLFAYANTDSQLPKQSLVRKVHDMNCFFTIWKSSSFWCLDPSNQRTTLPLSVTAQLRQFAKKALDSIEHDVLRELDDALTQQGPLKAHETLPVWASMWQLLLMYRELTVSFRDHIKSTEDSGPALAKKQSIYRWLKDVVLPLMAVFHHFQFRTNKVLEALVECVKTDMIRGDPVLQKVATDLISSRKAFYTKTQESKEYVDELLSALAVKSEAKKVNNPRRQPKENPKPRKAKETKRK